jgi:hypothetical protein
MSIEAVVTGNLLEDPSQRMVATKEGDVRITELRIMSDEYKWVGEDLVQDESKTSPVGVTIWNKRVGDDVMSVMKKGMRVDAFCDQFHLHRWLPDEAQAGAGKKPVYEMRGTARKVSLALNRVEKVTMRERSSDSAPPERG